MAMSKKQCSECGSEFNEELIDNEGMCPHCYHACEDYENEAYVRYCREMERRHEKQY
jgi:predicted Zn-ribbon and HTH transcriptional regulator